MKRRWFGMSPRGGGGWFSQDSSTLRPVTRSSASSSCWGESWGWGGGAGRCFTSFRRWTFRWFMSQRPDGTDETFVSEQSADEDQHKRHNGDFRSQVNTTHVVYHESPAGGTEFPVDVEATWLQYYPLFSCWDSLKSSRCQTQTRNVNYLTALNHSLSHMSLGSITASDWPTDQGNNGIDWKIKNHFNNICYFFISLIDSRFEAPRRRGVRHTA